MKIYTKTGDKGQTSLIGGTRVPKHHLRIEAYGTTDELNSYIGLCKNFVDNDAQVILHQVQEHLFTIGALLAADPEKSRMTLPALAIEDIAMLEKAIDTMNEQLPEMRSFVLPGGNVAVAHVHVARCICRRAERCITAIDEIAPIDNLIVQFVNRLSDYLFVLSRYTALLANCPEIP
ncbi:MAG: cob(I)yrinic acid a,c-diamide adenosyltransferase [Bacteroidetes bacterium]|nr:cob(I)yrinic acid a,c-diamide adenosyltransferase [Bacteroidota bacterium]